MKLIRLALISLLLPFLFADVGLAQRSGGGKSGSSRSSGRTSKATKGTSSSGVVHVRGYTRKDGTYVPEHDRTAPNDTKLDNWSTKGNINPETGKPGTKDPYPENKGVPSGSGLRVENAGDRAPITNSDIVEMLSAGVDSAEAKTIVLEASSDFDTCASALKELKSKGVPDELIHAMVTSTLSGESLGPPPEPTDTVKAASPPTTTGLRSHHAPELQGFDLGVNVDDAKTREGLSLPSDDVGVQRVIFISRGDPGVSRISLEFLDASLESIEVTYDGSVHWNSEDEFLSAVANRLSLPKAWTKESKYSHQQRIVGDGFVLEAQFNSGIIPMLHLYDPTAQETIKKRRAQQEDLKRRAFKP